MITPFKRSLYQHIKTINKNRHPVLVMAILYHNSHENAHTNCYNNVTGRPKVSLFSRLTWFFPPHSPAGSLAQGLYHNSSSRLYAGWSYI